MTQEANLNRIVYLIGAGASHACVKAGGSSHGILTKDLGPALAEKVSHLVKEKYQEHPSLKALVNTVIDEHTDFEHVITFLDEAASAVHRRFASDLRITFETVLRGRLDAIEEELGRVPSDLYEALLDMYQVANCPEVLGGILTINYDEYIEHAISKAYAGSADYGIRVLEGEPAAAATLRLLKLHGSFGWEDAWPIPGQRGATPLWIPPGIQKVKDRYPFNILWGLARELLECDVLRIIGCKLGPNDWDLISLIFTTCHTNAKGRPYRVEVIDAPAHAADLQAAFPYFDIRSILEAERIGQQLVAEFASGEPREYSSLSTEEQEQVRNAAGWKKNWFRVWLEQMAEDLHVQLGSVKTDNGSFAQLLETR